MVKPAAGDLLVDRIHPHRDIRGQHRRMGPAGTEGFGHRVRPATVLGLPLMGSGRTRGQFPFVAVQDFQIAVIPLGRGVRPDDLKAAGDGVLADSGAEVTLPAQALQLDRGVFRIRANGSVAAGAVGLAEGVTTNDQRRCLDVIHRHPSERLTDIHRGRQRIRNTLGTFGIDVDQAHRGGAQRVLQDSLAGVTGVGAQPGVLGTPVDVLIGLPTVLAAEGEAERLEAHRVHGVVTGKDHQIRPRQALAVLLLDRPQQPARLVQAGVIRPAADRREALHTGTGATAAILHPVSARRVPRHPHEERTVVAVVGRPPILRIGHHRFDIGLECIDVNGRDRCGVIEIGIHRIVLGGVLHQHLEVDLVGPPIAVAAPLYRRPDPHWAAARVVLSH